MKRSILLLLLLSACATTPLKTVQSGYEVIKQFDARTERLCIGANPILPKAECLDRIRVADKAQQSLNIAKNALAACKPNVPCETERFVLEAAQGALNELEGYVFRGEK